jgi:putative endonuclease
MGSRKELGEQGEAVAASWLATLGYRLLARNHHCREGEIDIVAEEGSCLCFVEVRTRGPSQVEPVETVDLRKQRRVVAAAEHYLLANVTATDERALRFDVVEVQVDAYDGLTLSLHRDAFEAGY